MPDLEGSAIMLIPITVPRLSRRILRRAEISVLVVLLMAVLWGCPYSAQRVIAWQRTTGAEEPEAISPFGARPTIRDDARQGIVELSDGTRYEGRVYLTRGTPLHVYDRASTRSYKFELAEIAEIQCRVEREWMEKEWRFKENANNQKVYTGRAYPAREYEHTVRLRDGRAVRGAVDGVLYVQESGDRPAKKLLLHRRDKGAVGSRPEALVYVRRVMFTEDSPPAFSTP